MSVFSVFSMIVALLPDSLLLFIFYGCFFIGIALILASWFITFIPLINRYRFPTQIVGILAYGLGAFLIGGSGVEMAWRARVEDLQKQVAEAEQKAKDANEAVTEKIVYRNKLVKEREVVYVDKIREVTKTIDAKCEVAPEALDILNRAAENPSNDGKSKK